MSITHARVKVIDIDHSVDGLTPTLRQWAGIEIGEVFDVEIYDDGQIWARTKKAFNGVDGWCEAGDWFTFENEEVEVLP